jgi:hypothetical protein
VSVLELDTIYDKTLRGEPLPRRVQSQPINTESALWTVGDWQLEMPAPAIETVPAVPSMLAEIRAWTGWSQRQLANALGTSHTTVGRAESGRPLQEARSGDLSSRVSNTHNLIKRLLILGGRQPEVTRRLLEVAPDAGRSPSPPWRRDCASSRVVG